MSDVEELVRESGCDAVDCVIEAMDEWAAHPEMAGKSLEFLAGFAEAARLVKACRESM